MAKTVTLRSGDKMPLVGLGTWQSKPEEVFQAVEVAIDAGYRLIDTAYAYQNEKTIGEAVAKKIKEGKVKREDLFITTKVHVQFLHRQDVVKCCKESLKNLGMDYVDLLLIHGSKDPNSLFPMKDGKPEFDMDYDLVDAWKGMEDCHKMGFARNIGVSNFNSIQIQRIMDNAEVKIANLQVECHAYFRQEPLFNFCQKLGISFTAYAPLGSPNRQAVITEQHKAAGDWGPMHDVKIKAIAEKYGKSAAHVCLKYLMQRSIAVIPKSVTPARIRTNFELFDFTLSDDDMNTINNLEYNERTFNMPLDFHPEYPWKKDIPF